LIRPLFRFVSARGVTTAALLVLSLSAIKAVAQQQVPQAPAQEPSAPAPPTTYEFPKQDPANFTAASPTKEVVTAFLEATWGYDTARRWQVQAIVKTPVEGISRVVVVVGDKTGKQKPAAIGFFVLPDGKHIIAGDDILVFGEHPFQEARATLQQKADGPYKGAATKDLELVEFADFQCPHCKDAQANMDKLAVDFPKARIVFQNYPLARIHPSATIAAGYGVCIAKMGGSSAYFQYAAAVYEGQDGLNTPDSTTLTLNSASSKAGQDPAKVAACAATPETKATVENSVKLAEALNINQTPVLMINGRMLPLGGLPYETIKQIVQYQAKLDGVEP
jgi:protein-disulfide isomerase